MRWQLIYTGNETQNKYNCYSGCKKPSVNTNFFIDSEEQKYQGKGTRQIIFIPICVFNNYDILFVWVFLVFIP